MKSILPVLLVLCTLTPALSQVGTWQSYTDMKNVSAFAVDDDQIIAATSGGVFIYDIQSAEFQKFTIVDGLASINLTSAFVDSKDRVFVGATSGHINMFEPEVGWTTIPDIARSTSRPQRGIRVIKERDGLLYIGTDFGVTVYNADANEFRDTYTKFGDLPLNTGVNDIFFRDNIIWLATDEGIAYADLKFENLQDPAQWGFYTTSDGLPSQVVNTLGLFRGNITAGTNEGLIILTGGTWTPSVPAISDKIVEIVNANGSAYFAREFDVFQITEFGNLKYIGEALIAPNYKSSTKISDLLVIGNDVYIGTQFGLGSSVIADNNRIPWSLIFPNGPNSNQFLSLSIDANGNLWSASGRDASGKGAYMFDGQTWTNFDKDNTPEFRTNNILWTAAAPNGDVWFGNWGQGLIRRNANGVFTSYTYRNVPGFPGIAEDENYAPIAGVTVDRSGNVYSLHAGSTQKMLSRYSTDGKWSFFGDPSLHSGTDFSGLSIDEFGNKWIIVTGNERKGLLVFNENATIDDQSDDTWTHVASGVSGDLLTEDISSLVVDGFGDIWIGASAGIRTIFNPLEPNRVTRTCYNTRCNIEGESITCLAVDPVNNKWIGTNSGVFVLSNDGSTILNQFNTDNSLLLDNEITSIVVHPTSGVVYIGTNKGLSAYTTPYQQAQADFTELKIYPNPFKPRTDLEVSIQGLVEESSVKILSVSGNLVAEFTTPGGNIGFWDGKTSDGGWAPSGIYYIAAYSADGQKAAVGKLAVINE